MKSLFQGLWKEQEGQDLVEYALIVALIALTLVAAIDSLANAISAVFSSASTSLS
jgi:pilus assembly protein Flp/PilA